jgi:hypothetical protein
MFLAIKRRMRPLNPYSWQNNRGRRSLDDYLDEDDAISVPGTMMVSSFFFNWLIVLLLVFEKEPPKWRLFLRKKNNVKK